MIRRLLTLIRKELLLLARDPQSRRLLLLPVILQGFLFPFAATLEVKNSTLAIFNQDGGAASVEIAQRLSQAKAFPTVLLLHSQQELRRVVDTQSALLVLQIPADFSRSIAGRKIANIQAIIDGRRSNSAQIVFGYAQEIIAGYVDEIARNHGQMAPSSIVIRHAYNPNLEYRWFTLPSLVAITATLGSLIVTALSVAREREQGTLEQLLVSPLTSGLIIVGKVVPAILVSLLQATLLTLIAVFIFGIPHQGSVALLYLGLLCYSASLAGFGIFISSLCATQQQAFLGVFSFMVPAIMLSGFIAPVENMPHALQFVALANPLRHFLPIIKGVFLKNFGFADSWPGLWPLLLIACVTLSLGYWMFQRRTSV